MPRRTFWEETERNESFDRWVRRVQRGRAQIARVSIGLGREAGRHDLDEVCESEEAPRLLDEDTVLDVDVHERGLAEVQAV